MRSFLTIQKYSGIVRLLESSSVDNSKRRSFFGALSGAQGRLLVHPILLQTETKLLSQLKKYHMFSSLVFQTLPDGRCQVPPVLKTIFIFRSWTPNMYVCMYVL